MVLNLNSSKKEGLMFKRPPPDRHCDFCFMVYGQESPPKETVCASRNFLAFFENESTPQFILIIPKFHEQWASRLLRMSGLKKEAKELARLAIERLKDNWSDPKPVLEWNDGKVPQCGITRTGPFIRKGTHANLKVSLLPE